MNWLLITLFSLFGAIMGILSVNGYTQKLEPFLWILFGIISALVLSKNVDNKVFIHALLIGLAWGILNSIIQASFFEKYLSNNQDLQANFQKSTIKPQYFVLLMGLIIGLVTGTVLGGLTILLRKVLGRSPFAT